MKNVDYLKNQEIKRKLGAKKSFFSLPDELSGTVGIVLAVAVSFLGTYFFLPWHGTVSAIPIVILCAFACVFFKCNEIFKAAVFFICPFSTSLLMGENVLNGVVFGTFSFVFYVLACFSVSMFKKDTKMFKAFSVVVLLLSFGVHVFANSTPWDVSESKGAILNYVKENYGGEPLYATDVRFNSFDRNYSLNLIPQHFENESLRVVLKDGKIVKDEYIEFSEKYNMLVGAGQITYVIRKMYPELKFSVERDRIVGYPFSSSATVSPKADYSKFMDFSVYFTSYNSAKEFTVLAEECYRELIKSGFYCRTITFYGGIGTKYVAKISVPFDSFLGNLENFVEPCNEIGFVYTALR